MRPSFRFWKASVPQLVYMVEFVNEKRFIGTSVFIEATAAHPEDVALERARLKIWPGPTWLPSETDPRRGRVDHLPHEYSVKIELIRRTGESR